MLLDLTELSSYLPLVSSFEFASLSVSPVSSLSVLFHNVSHLTEMVPNGLPGFLTVFYFFSSASDRAAFQAAKLLPRHHRAGVGVGMVMRREPTVKAPVPVSYKAL